jgi:hypothetical protein
MPYVIFGSWRQIEIQGPTVTVGAARVSWDNGVRKGWLPLWRAHGIFPTLKEAKAARHAAQEAGDPVSAKIAVKASPGYSPVDRPIS